MSVTRYAIKESTSKLWFSKSTRTPWVEDLAEAILWPERKYADTMKAQLDAVFPSADLEIHLIELIDNGELR